MTINATAPIRASLEMPRSIMCQPFMVQPAPDREPAPGFCRPQQAAHPTRRRRRGDASFLTGFDVDGGLLRLLAGLGHLLGGSRRRCGGLTLLQAILEAFDRT